MFQVVILKAVIFAYKIGKVRFKKYRFLIGKCVKWLAVTKLANKGFHISPNLTVIGAK
jgi:hypothetical protein